MHQDHRKNLQIARSHHLGTVVVVVMVGLLVLALFLYRQHQATGGLSGFPLDDSYIHLQFARNLAEGNGLAFLPERPVAGSTAPLWTAMLSPGFLVSTGFAMAFAKILGAGLFLFAAVDLAGWTRELGAKLWIGVLAGVLVVLTETLAFSALSGMEVPLFVALLVRGMRCWSAEERAGEERFATLGLFFLATSAIARPEGLLVVGLAMGERFLRLLVRRPSEFCGSEVSPKGLSKELFRSLMLGIGLLALILLPTGLLFFLWNGSMLPTTFAVKAGEGHQWLPSSRDVWQFAEVMFRVQPWMTVLAGAGAVSLLRRGSSLLPGLWVVALPLAYSGLSAPGRPVLLGNFGRYGFPLLPFVVLLGCLALDDLVRLAAKHAFLGRWIAGASVVHRGTRWRTRGLAVAVVLVVAFPCMLTTLRGANRSALAVRNVQDSDVAAAYWITKNLPGARIGTQDIGALGFFALPARGGAKTEPLAHGPAIEIVDLVGLVNPEILPFVRGVHQGTHPSGLGGLFEFVGRARLQYLLLFPESYGGLANLRLIRPDLEVVRRFKVEQNVAMAEDELVLLRLARLSER